MLKNLQFEKIREEFTIQAIKQNPKRAIKHVVIAYVGLKVIGYIVQKIHQRSQYAKWDAIAKKKKQVVDLNIKAFKENHLVGFNLSEERKEFIINSTITGLKKLIHSGQASITEILLTYIERTIKYATVNNWIADVCFEEALQQAIQQDKLVQQNRDILYQEGHELFGIPVSVKDMFMLKGYDATYGLASKCFNPDQFDGNQVFMIKKAGGIIFVKTNNPQIGYTIETNNFIFGRGKNPFSAAHIIGGSSGGEGAMMAGRCSVIGIGSDIGGSVRFPAAFNGVYSYKPSTRRICVSGQQPCHIAWDGYKNLVVTNGPIGRTVDDLALFMKVLLNEQNYQQAPLESKDIYFSPRSFDQKLYSQQKQLKIGFFKSFRMVPSSSVNQRAVEMAVKALQHKGHQVVEINLNDQLCEDALELAMKFCQADDYKVVIDILKGEKHIPEYDLLIATKDFSPCTKGVFSRLLKIFGLHRLDFVLRTGKKLSAYEYLCLSGKQTKAQAEMAFFWESQQLDGIIMPLFPTPALLHGGTKDTLPALIYAMIWNLFDYNAGVVSVTEVQANETSYQGNTPYTRRDPCTSQLERTMAHSLGMPVAVQVVTQPQRDEVCLSIMKDLEDEIRYVANPQLK